MIAAETLGRSYLSYDSGLTWTERLENRDWASVAWSGDGERVFAVAREGPLFMSISRVMPHRRVVSARAGPSSATDATVAQSNVLRYIGVLLFGVQGDIFFFSCRGRFDDMVTS